MICLVLNRSTFLHFYIFYPNPSVKIKELLPDSQYATKWRICYQNFNPWNIHLHNIICFAPLCPPPLPPARLLFSTSECFCIKGVPNFSTPLSPHLWYGPITGLDVFSKIRRIFTILTTTSIVFYLIKTVWIFDCNKKLSSNKKYLISAREDGEIIEGLECPINSYCLNGGSCVYYASLGELTCMWVW